MDQQSAINIAKKYKEAVVNAIGVYSHDIDPHSHDVDPLVRKSSPFKEPFRQLC